MAQEYSEIDLAASDTILIREILEDVIADERTPDDVKIKLLSLLNLVRIHEARTNVAAQAVRMGFRFARRATLNRHDYKEMQRLEEVYGETMRQIEGKELATMCAFTVPNKRSTK